MPARSGQAYVESLTKQAPCVYLGGRRVADVTAEPIFQEPIRAIAEQYDMQLDPACGCGESRGPPLGRGPARAAGGHR